MRLLGVAVVQYFGVYEVYESLGVLFWLNCADAVSVLVFQRFKPSFTPLLKVPTLQVVDYSQVVELRQLLLFVLVLYFALF